MPPSIQAFVLIVENSVLDNFPNSNLVTCEPTSNSSAYFECENERVMGRFTYWEDGSIFFECLVVSSGETTVSIHDRSRTESELTKALVAFQHHLLGSSA